MERIKQRLMKVERVELLAALSRAIHELTIRARFFYDRPDGIDGMRETNEAVHSISGHLRALVNANEPLTPSRADSIAEAMRLLAPGAPDRLYGADGSEKGANGGYGAPIHLAEIIAACYIANTMHHMD